MLKAVSIIKAGGVVAFPTETVYGLGADGTNEVACKKIYELKSRPTHNPLIVHVANIEEARNIGEFNEYAEIIASNLWPGPITIVVKRKKDSNICNIVSGGLDTIGIRVPANEIALELIRKSGVPIAAPSANISNYISPTEVSHVKDAFANQVYILEGGKSIYGLESTILDVSNNEKPQLLRYGFITPEIISKLIGYNIDLVKSNKILAPGMMSKHYAPQTKLLINSTYIEEGGIGLGFGEIDIGRLNLSKKSDLAEAASNLYSMLRILDHEAINLNKNFIAIAPIPSVGIGLAINDKLLRAIS